MILHLTSGSTHIELRIHAEDGAAPVLALAAGTPQGSVVEAEGRSRFGGGRFMSFALVAAIGFGIGGYVLTPRSKATAPARPSLANNAPEVGAAAPLPPPLLRGLNQPPVVTPPPGLSAPAARPGGNPFGLE